MDRLPKLEPIATAGTAAASIVQPLFILATVGLIIHQVARAAETSAAEKVRESPAAYLMYAQEELTPRSVTDRLRVGARHFALGV
jgi:hypothetical protein